MVNENVNLKVISKIIFDLFYIDNNATHYSINFDSCIIFKKKLGQ